MVFAVIHLKTLSIALALLFILATASLALAQQDPQRISGAVVDASDGNPLAGVAVIAKGAGVETRTGPKGRFSLTVPSGHQVHLVFRRKGYRPMTKAIDDSTSAIIVSMKRGK